MRRFLLSFILTLVLISVIFLTLRVNLQTTDVAAVTPASVSDFPVITPDNVDRLAPIVTLTRGGRNYENALRYPVWSPDSQFLAVIADGSEGIPSRGVWLYDVENPEMPPRQFEHENAYYMVFSPDGSRLATLSNTRFAGGKAVVWDIATGEQELVLDDDTATFDMRFNADGTRFITDDSNNMWVWDIASGQEISFLNAGCDLVFNQAVTIMADADCGWSGIITLVELETGQQVLVGEQQSAVSNIAFSLDGRRLAAWDNDCGLKLWGLTTGSSDLEIKNPECDPGHGNGLEFNPDGAVLASWGVSGRTIELWSTTTGEQLAALEGHYVPGYEDSPGGSSLNAAFSPDGALIASFWADSSDTEDDYLRIWDAASGDLLLTIPDEYNATFSPDGTMLATDSSDGSVKIWAVG